MTKITVPLELATPTYSDLLAKANKIGVTPADLVAAIVSNYVRGQEYNEYWITQDAIQINYVRAIPND